MTALSSPATASVWPFDRLLARLRAVADGQWLLKGGFALELRLAGHARATKDIDVDWQADEEQMPEMLIDAAGHDPGDYFTFAIERTNTPADRLGGSHRFRVTASLAGRLFETFLLDVGFRSGERLAADILTTEALLAFAEIPPQDWAVQYRRLAQEVDAPVDLAAGHAEASVFLTPVLSGAVRNGTWNCSQHRWLPNRLES